MPSIPPRAASLSILLGLSLGLSSGSATAGVPVYQPLEPGTTWTYASDSVQEEVTILGTEMVGGVLTTVREHRIPGEVYRNMWTVDEQGDVRLHAARNVTFEFFAEYDPPILWFDAPLSVGKTWDWCHSEPPPCEKGDPFTHFEVLMDRPVTVPAGTFDAFAVGNWIEITSSAPGFDVLGRSIRGGERRGGPGEPDIWVNDGIGTIQYRDPGGVLFRLVSTGSSTPAVARSWAAIKDGFRGK